MMRTIVVPLDETGLSSRVLPVAAHLANHSGAGIVLLPHRVYYLRRATSDLVHGSEAAAARLRSRGIAVQVDGRAGQTVDVIVDVAGRPDVTHIVMATPPRSELASAVRGDVVEDTLRRAPVPVVLVTTSTREVEACPFDRILVPLDGSLEAERALPAVAALGRDARSATLLLLRVIEPVRLRTRTLAPAATRAYLQSSQAQARGYLEVLAAQLRVTVPRVDVRVVVGDPARVIGALADQYAAAIAMVTRGRATLGRLLLGSVTRTVLRHTGGPLLLLAPAAVDRPQQTVDAPTHRAATTGMLHAPSTEPVGIGRQL
jgi:nucleotide-binding universal stress UspA family protein